MFVRVDKHRVDRSSQPLLVERTPQPPPPPGRWTLIGHAGRGYRCDGSFTLIV